MLIRDVELPNVGNDLSTALRYRCNLQQAYAEGYQEFIERAISWTVDDVHYRVHENVNLYVDTTASCSCRCPFCICNVTFPRRHGPYPEMATFLEQALKLCELVRPSVQIVGGEPTLYSQDLAALLDVIDASAVRRPVLGTNGYGLDDAMVDRLNSSSLEHVNISRHHYNDVKNHQIMDGGVTSKWLAKSLPNLKASIRVQCNLLAGEIDTYGEIMQFIAYAYHRLGVRTVAFAQLTPLPSGSFYDRSVIDYCSAKLVNLPSILTRVDEDRRFRFVKYRGGVACYYEIREFTAYEEPMTILFKFSDNAWLERADAEPDLIPDLVLHTDGTLSGSWCPNRKVLATYGRPPRG